MPIAWPASTSPPLRNKREQTCDPPAPPSRVPSLGPAPAAPVAGACTPRGPFLKTSRNDAGRRPVGILLAHAAPPMGPGPVDPVACRPAHCPFQD